MKIYCLINKGEIPTKGDNKFTKLDTRHTPPEKNTNQLKGYSLCIINTQHSQITKSDNRQNGFPRKKYE